MALENIDPEIEALAEQYLSEVNLLDTELQTNLGAISVKTLVLGFTKYMEAWKK